MAQAPRTAHVPRLPHPSGRPPQKDDASTLIALQASGPRLLTAQRVLELSCRCMPGVSSRSTLPSHHRVLSRRFLSSPDGRACCALGRADASFGHGVYQ
eukprot:354411-Chlamydomonas_euryale.AAC.20